MKLFKFNQFILEKLDKKVPLQWSKNFGSVLSKIDSPIKEALLEDRLEDSLFTLLHFGDREDTISYTPSSKIWDKFDLDKHKPYKKLFLKPLTNSDAKIYNTNRNQIKIGRFIKKQYFDTFSNQEIESFVNQYKSQFEEKKLEFEWYHKSDIKEAYVSNKYTFEFGSTNELLNSCMNDKLDLIDFYYGCPVSLIALKDQKGYIWGRSLIWDLKSTKYGDIKFMDRVYAVNQETYFKFINFAKENKYWWKSENKSNPDIKLTDGKKTEYFKIDVPISFDFEEYKEWGVPYLDTFCFTQDNKLMNYEPEKGRYYELIDTEGDVLELSSRS